MITSHHVLQDTPLLHLAYLEFKAPFPSSETFQLPRQGRSWIWRVDFFDSQGDGVNDDLYIRGWHLKPPHLGELVNNPVTGHGYVRVDLLDAGPQFSRNGHNRHFDTLSSVIRQPQPTDGGFGSFFSILPARRLSPTFPIFPTPASSYHRRMASLSVASLFHPRESVHERRAQGGENGASKDSGRESHTTRC